MINAKKGVVTFEEVPSHEELPVSWRLPTGVSLDLRQESLTLEEGEKRILVFPTGTLSVPWLPKDARVYIGTNADAELPLLAENRVNGSFAFLTGTYPVRIQGSLSYGTTVTIKAGVRFELPFYREVALEQVPMVRGKDAAQVARIKTRRTFSILSLGADAVGTALSGFAYTQGMAARSDYQNVNTSDALLAARSAVEQWGVLFAAGTGVGGLGFFHRSTPVAMEQPAGRA